MSIDETAALLGISKASIHNWIRHGYLKAIDQKRKTFRTTDVLALQADISQGKINRLKSRANKKIANKQYLPKEYSVGKRSRDQLRSLLKDLKSHCRKPEWGLFLVALQLFQQQNEFILDDKGDLFPIKQEMFHRKSVYLEMVEYWHQILNQERPDEKTMQGFLEWDLPAERDLLGILYQSIKAEGEKAKKGAYYTPAEIVDQMVEENYQPGQRVLDPCCGTGQFLLSCIEQTNEPSQIIGLDMDPMAVRIARINVLLHTSQDERPQIYPCNTLEALLIEKEQEPRGFDGFDFIATNPPWGAEITRVTQKKWKRKFPEIGSSESFSYFLRGSVEMLREGGTLSFLLPESFCWVRIHRDIRKFLLENYHITRLEVLGKRFQHVMSSVIRLDLRKVKINVHTETLLVKEGETFLVPQHTFTQNKWLVMDFLNRMDRQIIGKVYGTPHCTLEGKAEWALGIVTGDNQKYLKDAPEEGTEPIIKGSDIQPFCLAQPTSFIRFEPQRFQQTAPEDKYRKTEKLVYRFIADRPVFAYDSTGSLTLNSANSLIPRLDYPPKRILALFNSSLYGYLYRKKVHSLKVLRGDLEQLPLPIWPEESWKSIDQLTEGLLRGEDKFAELDQSILALYNLKPTEIQVVLNALDREKE